MHLLQLLLFLSVLSYNVFFAETQFLEFDHSRYLEFADKDLEMWCQSYGSHLITGFYKENLTTAITENSRIRIFKQSSQAQAITIKSLTESDAGIYVCKAEKKGQVKTAKTSLIIKAQIKGIKAVYYLAQGKRGNLKVVLRGSPVPNVIWSKKIGTTWQDIATYTDGKLKSSTGFDLTSGLSLVIKNASATHIGRYRIRIKQNSLVATKATSVLVGEPPVLQTAPPASFNTLRGRNVVLECTFSNADKIMWMYESALSNVKVSDNKLSISAVKRSNQGTYNCSATNKYGTTSKMSRLQYVIEPGTVLMEAKYEAEFRSSINLTCSWSGYPQPKVYWHWKGMRGTYVKLSGHQESDTKSVYTITSLGLSHAGVYNCTADYGTLSDGRNVTSGASTLVTVYETCRSKHENCPTSSYCITLRHDYHCRCNLGYIMVGRKCNSGKLFLVKGLIFKDAWKSAYANQKSAAFLGKALEYESELTAQCKQNGCLGTQIVAMKPGSVIADVHIVYPLSSTITIGHIQTYLTKLTNSSNISVKDLPKASAIVSDLCQANGLRCADNSYCATNTAAGTGITYACKCNNGYSKSPTGECTAVTKGKKGSDTTVVIAAAVCAVFVLILAALAFTIWRRRRIAEKHRRSSRIPIPGSSSQNSPGIENSQYTFHGQLNNTETSPYEPLDADAVSNPSYALPSKMIKNAFSVQNKHGQPSYGQHNDTSDNVPTDQTEPVYELYDSSPRGGNRPFKHAHANTAALTPKENTGYESNFTEEPVYALYGTGNEEPDRPLYVYARPEMPDPETVYEMDTEPAYSQPDKNVKAGNIPKKDYSEKQEEPVYAIYEDRYGIA